MPPASFARWSLHTVTMVATEAQLVSAFGCAGFTQVGTLTEIRLTRSQDLLVGEKKGSQTNFRVRKKIPTSESWAALPVLRHSRAMWARVKSNMVIYKISNRWTEGLMTIKVPQQHAPSVEMKEWMEHTGTAHQVLTLPNTFLERVRTMEHNYTCITVGGSCRARCIWNKISTVPSWASVNHNLVKVLVM